MTVSALSELACLASGSTSTLSDLIAKVEDSGPEGNDLTEPLKPFAGKVLRLEAKDPQGRLLIKSSIERTKKRGLQMLILKPSLLTDRAEIPFKECDPLRLI